MKRTNSGLAEPNEESDVSPQLAAAIVAAAVCASVPEPHRIIDVQLVSDESEQANSSVNHWVSSRNKWALEGRVETFSSRRVR